MEIRIAGTCPDKCWYNSKQGQVYTVVEPPKGFYNGEYAYYVEHPGNSEGVTYWVWKEDCEVVEELDHSGA